ncbi:TPA: sigma factor-like helix-turn-helix DNA-binding protein [Pseudomonas aeruginosa]
MHASTSTTTAAGSDETLLARYRKGDSAAFEVLYQRHRQGLYRFLCGLAGQTELADEIYQETWLSLSRDGERLQSALETLPEEQREVFLMRAHGELELAEIATLTQSPLETVKSRFRYAVQKLRRLLAEEVAV